MKTAAKAFIIIGMICTFYYIFPIIFGLKALKKLKNATCASELKTTGILTLIFVSIPAGIILLCMQDNHLSN